MMFLHDWLGNTLIFMFLFSELEAKEACEWLRAAGFPQYAQLYEGNSSCDGMYHAFQP